jgi:hypothetical protein
MMPPGETQCTPTLFSSREAREKAEARGKDDADRPSCQVWDSRELTSPARLARPDATLLGRGCTPPLPTALPLAAPTPGRWERP